MCRSDSVRDLAFASRSEKKIICTLPPLNAPPVHPSKVGRLLASDPRLQPLVAKALEIRALSRLCVDFLPPGLARLVRAANLKDGQLVVLAATPAAAAKLKLLSESLCKFLLQQGAKVKAVSVRVQPTMPQPVDFAAHKAPRLSAAGIASLSALYERLPDSPARRALKALLERHAAAPEAPVRSPPGAASRRRRRAPLRGARK
ncbi:MAG: DciA family protein [Burkholderiales bacterium]